ncbi:MAG TPA: ABC transporter permease [Azospirillaceae bacterium]|nr:ABC transporter permease [Azospirillaceae bacterium]
MRLAGYIGMRLAEALLTLLGIAVLVFIAIRLLPGGYAELVLGNQIEPEARAYLNAKYGLDKPMLEQFWAWLSATAQGNLGTSVVTQRSISDEFLRRAPATIELAALATVIAVLVGIPLGVVSGLGDASPAWRTGGRLIGAVGASLPEFVLGTILLTVASSWSMGFTQNGFVGLLQDPAANLRAMALPAASLSVFGIALILRTTRDAVRRTTTEPYIITAVARGDPPRRIIRSHILRNASIPVVTVSSTFVGSLLGGAVVAEVLFSIPGVGLYVFNALGNRDFGVVQAGVLMAAAIFVTINMLADIAYAVIDPRIGSRIGG